MGPLEISITLVSFAVLVGFWALVRVFKKREESTKTALETAQKLFDLTSSKLNILMRALPNLHALLIGTHSTDGWKVLFLDEARGLIRADGASFWRYNEGNQTCELDTARGVDMKLASHDRVQSLTNNNWGDVVKNRQVQILENGDLLSPLVVESVVWGVLRFTRNGTPIFESKDVELIRMFTKQLCLALENQSMTANREKFYLELVQALADTLDARDASREGQTRQARVLARGIGKEMALPDEFVYYLEFAALMHDIGNIVIDEQLLKKPGKLTNQEFDIIKKHPEYGYKILAPVTLLEPVAPMVLYHQEWFNGTGYPDGLVGEEIPLGARIVAVLDAWGAMTSHRPWRRALSKEEALNEIKKGAGTQFDPKVVDAFLSTLRKQGLAV